MRMVALILIHLIFAPQAWGEMHEFSNKKLHTKLGIDLPGYDLNLKSDTREVKFKPNIRALYAVGLSLQDFIGINWGFRATQTEKEETLKCDTEYEDWRLNLAFKQFHLFFNYSQYRGFFIEDSREVDNTWVSGQPYVQAPNLSSRTAGANFTWVVSPDRYSLVAAIDQTERQEKSGGSWLLGTAVSETVFRDHDEIIPTQVQSEYGADLYSGVAAAADATSYDTGSIDITTTLYVIKTYFGFRI